jgi:hypothetical protein
MAWLLPSGLRESYQGLERFGLYLVVIFVYFVPGVMGLVRGTMEAMGHAIRAIVTVGGAW